MKIISESREFFEMRSDPLDFGMAEPMMLIHLNQKLAYARKGIAMAFTGVEISVLSYLLLRRARELETKQS